MKTYYQGVLLSIFGCPLFLVLAAIAVFFTVIISTSRFAMKTRLIVGLGFSVILSSLVFWRLAELAGADPQSGILFWVKAYRDSLRSPLFTGFFTIGGFLLTLKSAILMRIKEIYDTDDYATKWEVWKDQLKREGNDPSECEYYGPLKNLGMALMANVVFALFSSLLQMTIGFINSAFSIAICLGFAFTTICLVIFLSYQISENLMMWFENIESEKKNTLKK